MSSEYEKAGVSLSAGYNFIKAIKKISSQTRNQNSLEEIGSFASLYDLSNFDIKEPVLVSGTDGVGTKLKLAFMTQKHDTVGIDCVAMCVNDILCQGAKPLFFLDYIATGKIEQNILEHVIYGVSTGCKIANMSLVGGETAEMPGFYPKGEYDLAGFAVGIVDKSRILGSNKVNEGSILVALASSGLHSNGFSLVRKVLLDDNGYSVYNTVADFPNQTLGEVLLTPTKIYASVLEPLLEEGLIQAAAHITGGGFFENIPRMLPANTQAIIDTNSWKIPKIFEFIQNVGKIPSSQMYQVFNQGVGMVLSVAKPKVDQVLQILDNLNEQAWIIGEVKSVSSPIIDKVILQ